ncbi:UspA domain protein [Gloeothece citriformis PCC 7424]|uniref:UspA domain protein n=1 Tax=Gloeothece citriformis (strain PCC 7424) TaxID=65393 RepID=B7KD22_GLOC7|nr:universal stress protein [Gloeothece citriformis]ACK73143.1 UspA domain protein [Gloeothece citriformis PCC 7424]
MGYKKILVALDRSSNSDPIFEQALELCQQEAAELLLFHCIPIEHSISSYSNLYGEELTYFSQMIQQQLETEKKEVEHWLRECCEKAQEKGIKAQWDWKIGEAGRLICQMRDNWQADLLILGRRGRRGLTEMFLGSVSNYVVHHAPCSVLVVQGVIST